MTVPMSRPSSTAPPGRRGEIALHARAGGADLGDGGDDRGRLAHVRGRADASSSMLGRGRGRAPPRRPADVVSAVRRRSGRRDRAIEQAGVEMRQAEMRGEPPASVPLPEAAGPSIAMIMAASARNGRRAFPCSVRKLGKARRDHRRVVDGHRLVGGEPHDEEAHGDAMVEMRGDECRRRRPARCRARSGRRPRSHVRRRPRQDRRRWRRGGRIP